MAKVNEERQLGPAASAPRQGTLSSLIAQILHKSGRNEQATFPPLRRGTLIGRFELLEEVGRGGFGVVYEALDRELGRTVAFKLVKGGGQPVSEERLVREAEVAARLSHPNLVTLFDAGRSEHGPFLVLELLRGQTLARRLEQGPITSGEALDIATEIAQGLAYAHRNGVVHRDLTPGNVFLCDDGRVKVLDLGMAHACGRRKVEGGTPAYMAPEQWRGAPEDERTDVFALGVILYRMLADELPFPSDRPRALVSSRKAPAIEVPAVPALAELIARMLEKDPVRRPRDAAQVLTVLAALRAEHGASPQPSGGPPARKSRRRTPLIATIAAASLALGLLLGLLLASRPGWLFPAPPPASIAVLPFLDMSPQRDEEYFADGLAEEILSSLAQVKGLRVAGRASSFSFKGKNEDLRSIGHQLNVDSVLEGSVRKSGERIRITAEVVSVRDGFRVWSQEFDREADDTFSVQDEIARAVVGALEPKIAPGPRTGPAGGRTENARAYALYLLGRQHQLRGTADDARTAVQELEGAVGLDPAYAAAWARLALARFQASDYAPTPADVAAEQQRALQAAEKAVALGPDRADGYAARSYLRSNMLRDWPGARDDLQHALSLAPGDAYNYQRMGSLELSAGRLRQSVAALRTAAKLDPLSRGVWTLLAFAYTASDDLTRARDAVGRSLEIAPGSSLGMSTLTEVLLLQGQPAQALATARQIKDELWRQWGVSLAQHTLGNEAESRRALEALIEHSGATAGYQIAGAYAWRGERDQAFAWLERAYAQHDGGLSILKVDPVFGALRRDPRYAALLEKMNLPRD